MARHGRRYDERSKLSLPRHWPRCQFWEDFFANIGYLFCAPASNAWVGSSPSRTPFLPRRVVHQVQ
eukprot:5352321-Karenia_brevis.AAC.1